MKSVQRHNIAFEIERNRLVRELRNLQQKLGLGYELDVVWLPGADEKLAGEVVENQIRVYEEDVEKAVETLKHEFIDYVISKVMEPYERIANKLIQMTNEEAYRRKEKLTEALVKLV